VSGEDARTYASWWRQLGDEGWRLYRTMTDDAAPSWLLQLAKTAVNTCHLIANALENEAVRRLPADT
jgi:hypothetical protein